MNSYKESHIRRAWERQTAGRLGEVDEDLEKICESQQQKTRQRRCGSCASLHHQCPFEQHEESCHPRWFYAVPQVS
jgi:hypothetical protein